jgi:hypothetical protein
LKKGIRYGVLIGIALFVAYIYAFFGVGIYLVWTGGWPADGMAWIELALKSLVYFVIGFAGFMIVLLLSIFFILRDRNYKHITVPLVITLVYLMLPIPIPGPIDEALVFAIGYWLKTRALTHYRDEKVIDIEKVDS